jgi:hypothetical protein
MIDHAGQILLFAGACAGHLAILSVSLNLWYGHALPRWSLSLLRKVHTLLVPAGPAAFVLLYGFDLTPVAQGFFAGLVEADKTISSSVLQVLPGVYLWACWAVGLGVLPAVTVRRLLRRGPEALQSNHTQTVDVVGQLGYRPVGNGKYRHLARLPGNQVFQVDFTEKTLCWPGLPPAWDGLSLLHLSDLHLCGTPGKDFYFQVVDRCREWRPDIVAITGDIVDSPHHHRWVLPVLGRLQWKVAAFAVLGNHDAWYEPGHVRRRLRRLGIRVLGNRWEQVEVRGEPMIVLGHEGPWFAPPPELPPLPDPSPLVPPQGEFPPPPLRGRVGVGGNAFRLCLSHTPDNLPWARQHGVQLMLAGHNHGGQVRLPVIGSILVPSRYSRRYDCGMFYEAPTHLHVSRGLAGQHPLRYNCRPEVTLIILRAAETDGERK